ncbi:MAG: hypothetical protein ABI422_06910 [Sphingomicrobium sp.]
MQFSSISKKFAGGLVALALCTSSTGAIASSVHVPSQASISPWVALSALGSDASRTALCGAAAAAAAGAAAVAQGAGPGCVLPVVDSGSPVVSEALPPPPVAPPPVAPIGEGFGISPILLALVAVAAGVGLYFLLHKKKNSSPA